MHVGSTTVDYRTDVNNNIDICYTDRYLIIIITMDTGSHIWTGLVTFLAIISLNMAQLPVPVGHIPDTPVVVINEFDVSNENQGQYVELFDGGIGNTSLNGLALVLLKGVTGGTVYATPTLLENMVTNDRGYFLLATSSFDFEELKDMTTIANIRYDGGVNAIAIYNITENNLELGSAVTSEGLLDAVVYGNASNSENDPLVTTLLPGKDLLQDTSPTSSLSRCRGWHGLMPSSFWVTNKTPFRENDCAFPKIVLNEMNAIHTGNLGDVFIELYDGGIGDQSLDGIILAFYHFELDLSFLAIDLTNRRTNAAGFFVVGVTPNPGYDLAIYPFSLPNGIALPNPDAIALHLASPRRFKNYVLVSNYRLIDAFVYGDTNTTDLTLLHTLLPYQDLVTEVTGPTNEDLSVSRCVCCNRLDASSFGEGSPTPGAINTDCTLSNRTVTETAKLYQRLVRINEVKIMDPNRPDNVGEFVELALSGFGSVKLDGIVLVIYDRLYSSYRTIGLNGTKTNSAGIFVIGKPGVQPTPDLIVNDAEPLISGASAIALYWGSADDFPDGTRPGNDGLLDVVVIGFPGDLVARLLFFFTRGQSIIELKPNGTGVFPSILRCYSSNSKTQLAFVLGAPSPSVANSCPLPPIVINELNVITSNSGTAEFLEISSSGIANFPLDTLSVILWTATGVKGGISLSGWKTDRNGLFVIEQSNVQGTRPSFPLSLATTITNGPGALSIHVGRLGLFPPESRLTNRSLVDALVFGIKKTDNVPQEMIDVLTPGRPWFYEDELIKYEDVSINRCKRSNGSIEYILDNLSPNATNYCPRQTDTKIIINEVHLTSTSQMVVELWDMGVGFTEMTGLQLVFFQESGLFSMAYNLTGQTDRRGYYIVGHIMRPLPNVTISRGFTLPEGGAVAIYETAQSFASGDPPTNVALMSAVVHLKNLPSPAALDNFHILTPESDPFVELNTSALNTRSKALSRCFNSSGRISSEAFLPRSKTLRGFNDCPVLPNDVYINEVEVTKLQSFIPFVMEEFIELYDGGHGNTSMTYLTLVLFDGGVPYFSGFSSDVSFFSLSLDGYKTNSEGYFVIGSSLLDDDVVDYKIDTSTVPFLQFGIVGVALYRGPVGAFSKGTNATHTSLIDALIYVTGLQALDHSLVNILLPDVSGIGMIRETGSWLEGHGSISRCLGKQLGDPQAFILTETPTPRKENNCSSITTDFKTVLVFNEVDLDAEDILIELYDFGRGNTSLDTLILVAFIDPLLPGAQPTSVFTVDLHGYSTNKEGYFVIGTNASSDKVITAYLRGIIAGVGLYHAKTLQFPTGTLPTRQNLIDAVVTSTRFNNSLANILVPGQAGVSDMDTDGVQQSVSRCFTKKPLDMFAFWPSTPTPGSDNICTRTEVVINEINANHAALFGQEYQEFIELYDGGVGHTPLAGTVLVIYNGGNINKAYRVIPLNNQTNEAGYFVIGRPNRNFTADLLITGRRQLIPNDAGGIALYHDDIRNYMEGQEPTNDNLEDAVVYSSQNFSNDVLINALLPGQSQVTEDQGFLIGDESIIRCMCCTALQTSAYKLGRPSPGKENICFTITPTNIPTAIVPTAPSSFQVQINEIGMKTHFFTSEYIELKGKPNLAMDTYFIVLYNLEGVSYYSQQLEKAIGPDGFYLIGSPNMSPPPIVRFPTSLQGVIQVGGAVALYYGYASPEGSDATDKNLVDAMVYSTTVYIIVAAKIDVLTLTQQQFFADLTREESITRCYWETWRKNDDFTQSLRTPGKENDCPSEEFKQTVQLKLADADYSTWKKSDTNSLRQKIIEGINQNCLCGFSYHYIINEFILKGSVVYQADVLAFNTNQSLQIYEGYSSFVQDAKTLEIGGKNYQVENCIQGCVAMPTTEESGHKNETYVVKQGNKGAAVGATIGVILLVVLIGVVIFILIRKRIICYEKDAALTEDEGGNSQKLDDLGDGSLQFRNNTYEPAY